MLLSRLHLRHPDRHYELNLLGRHPLLPEGVTEALRLLVEVEV